MLLLSQGGIFGLMPLHISTIFTDLYVNTKINTLTDQCLSLLIDGNTVKPNHPANIKTNIISFIPNKLV